MFRASDVPSLYDSVRALCAGLDIDELPNTVIDLPIYSSKVVNRLNRKYPTYDSLSVDKKEKAQIAACYLIAALLCRSYCKGRIFRLTDNKNEAELAKVDWDKLADNLEQLGEQEINLIDEATVIASSAIILSPSYTNSATGQRQQLVQCDDNDHEE